MKRLSIRSTFLSCILLLSATAPRALAAQQTASDPFIWLEDIDGKRSMDLEADERFGSRQK